ncbi:hypothetical protein TorRG33x02_328820, partial [Trema orientale]
IGNSIHTVRRHTGPTLLAVNGCPTTEIKGHESYANRTIFCLQFRCQTSYGHTAHMSGCVSMSLSIFDQSQPITRRQ